MPPVSVVVRKTARLFQQTLSWAAAYNLLALPLAAAGLVTPWLAALGMAASSLVVTLNALRLARVAPAADSAGTSPAVAAAIRP